MGGALLTFTQGSNKTPRMGHYICRTRDMWGKEEEASSCSTSCRMSSSLFLRIQGLRDEGLLKSRHRCMEVDRPRIGEGTVVAMLYGVCKRMLPKFPPENIVGGLPVLGESQLSS